METLKDLKKAYEQAIRENSETVKIAGFEFETEQVKHILTVMEMKKTPDDTTLHHLFPPKDGYVAS